jgi:hypothetical protein
VRGLTKVTRKIGQNNPRDMKGLLVIAEQDFDSCANCWRATLFAPAHNCLDFPRLVHVIEL